MNYGLKNAKLSTDYPESNLKRDMKRNEECRRTSDTVELKCFCNLLSTIFLGCNPMLSIS